MKGDLDSRTRNRPRVLWGRVAFYGLTLVLAFALGSWSSGDDTSDAELHEASAEIERLTQENVHLRAEKEALEAGESLDAAASDEGGGDADPGDAGDAGSAGAEDGGAAEGGASDEAPDADESDEDAADAAESPDAAGSEAGTYVVQEGDTGISIAEAVYGDPDLWPLIADANDLDGANSLQVNQELVIPASE